MIRTLALIIAASALPLAVSAQAANIQITPQNPVVELSVSEIINSAPDTATFSTGVQTSAPTAAEALRQNSVRVRQVIDKLKSLGIADKDIQTTGINLNAEYEYIRATETNRFKGYQVSNEVSAKVRDINKLGGILDAVVSSGATNLNGPYFSLEDDLEVKAAARERALERGREQALSYARAAGYSGVQMLSVSEGISGQSQMPQPQFRNVIAVTALQSSAPVQPGQVGTQVDVNIAYEMTR